jgi:hypothetical protein
VFFGELFVRNWALLRPKKNHGGLPLKMLVNNLKMMRTFLVFVGAFLFSFKAFCQLDTVAEIPHGKWGFGMELGPCTGMYFLSGDAKGKISEGWCYANVGLTLSYAKFHFMLQTGGVSGSVKEELAYGPEWKKGNRFGTAHLQLSVGYELLATRYFNIIPFVSGGFTAFNTQPDSTHAKGIATRFTPSYAAGTAFDLKMNFPVFKRKRDPDVVYTRSYLYLRLLTGIYPTYFQNPLGINGSMYFVNLSVGFYASGRPAK